MTIVSENLLDGELAGWYTIGGAGDMTVVGFCREFSVNVGDIAHFSCHGPGTVIDIYRIGYYGGRGWRKITTLTNTPTTQPAPATVPGSNGGTTCTAWSTTAQWAVPADTTSGLFVGVFRNAAGNNASWIPFVVRNDELEADIVYKFSDATWALAYNHYNNQTDAFNGRNVYGLGGVGNILDRTYFTTYHKPIVTRQGVPQTYWYNAEYPMIRWMERNGYNVKYIASKDLDRDQTLLRKGKIFVSCGHDEYWSQNMRSAVESWRDEYAGHSLFLSGNEVFWQTRFTDAGVNMWCYKDTMPGPGSHVAGVPLDPVGWTGTWKDQRRPGYNPNYHPEWMLTGTDFRMNMMGEGSPLIVSNPYGGHPVWGGSARVEQSITVQNVLGFEADEFRPTQPTDSISVLATYLRNIDGNRADNNGQTYNGNGNMLWGIIAQRYNGGALTVGFGTCQWSWALDEVHDRGGGTPTNIDAQQFTVNLLRDLGAEPATLQAGVELQAVNDLDVYGIEPADIVAPATRSNVEEADGDDLGLKTPAGAPLMIS